TRHFFTNPLSPLAYTPVSRTISANSEMFVRLLRRYPKPEWGIDEVISNGERVTVTREITIDKPFCQLLHFQVARRCAAQVVDCRAAVRSLCNPVARYSAHCAGRPRCLDYGLGGCKDGAVGSRSISPRRLCRLYLRVHQSAFATAECDVGMPADCTGAGRGVLDGFAKRSGRAQGDDHDGWTDRYTPQSHFGERFCGRTPAFLVFRPRDHASAGELPWI